MKNLLTSLSIILLSALIFSSCSSSWTFSKRRYTKGYYVSHSSKTSAPAEKQARSVRPESTVAKSVVPAVPSASEPKSEPLLTASAVEAAASPAKAQVASLRKTAEQPALHLAKKSIREHLKPLDNAIRQHQLAAGDDEGLSLFWIVIVVVLILWALGLISGNFGAIINLLLVIALILLILWLLRIL